MHRISPAPPERFAEVAEHMERWKKQKGYPPNSWLTMLRKPRVFRAYRELHSAVMMEPGEVPKGLKFMIAGLVSMTAGDPYCAAHNAENAAHLGGVELAKIEALALFRTSALFNEAERAALELAEAAGHSPSRVTDSHFGELKKHYSEDAIVEIVAVLALVGWLNRWCTTFAPELEPDAAAFAEKHLAPSGWTPGVHAPPRTSS
jgi:alkylhydroperoxidase family enzyme